jgi:hypothetical protein
MRCILEPMMYIKDKQAYRERQADAFHAAEQNLEVSSSMSSHSNGNILPSIAERVYEECTCFCACAATEFAVSLPVDPLSTRWKQIGSEKSTGNRVR